MKSNRKHKSKKAKKIWKKYENEIKILNKKLIFYIINYEIYNIQSKH
jgi:hypothetical protein